MAKKVEGLNLRGSRWYMRVLVPKDLQPVYGKTRFNFTLDTSDARDATLLGILKRAEWEAAFDGKRAELNPAQLDAVPHELAKVIASRVRAAVLADDDRVRADLPLLAEMVHVRRELERRAQHPLIIPQWDLPIPRIDDLTGATEDELRELADSNAHMDGNAAIALARGNLMAVAPLVHAEAAKLGVSFNVKAPGAPEALRLALAEYRKAHREVTMRDAGEVVPTPTAPSLPVPAPATKRTLREVFNKWRQSGDEPRSADSIAATERALRQFEEKHPGLELKALNREVGESYRVWLRDLDGISSKTARDRLTALKSLLKYAAQTLEWIERHPWVGLDIKSKAADPPRPWTEKELQVLFSSSLHTAYDLPSAKHAGRDAAYWLPLLGLFTGSRLGELCQLQVADVREVEGIPVLVLTDEGEGQSMKTESSRRSLPIHSTLIRLGFLEYVDRMRQAKQTSLWPLLPLREGKPSDYFGRWFSKHRKALGLTGSYPDFHSFRHTVRAPMRRAGFSEATQDKVTGHKVKGSIGTVVYDHHTLEEIQGAVEAIEYPSLRLPKIAVKQQP